MTPGPLREAELADPAQLLRWLNSLRDAVRDLERRPRILLWSAGPIDISVAVGGTISLDAPPWTVGAVVLASVVRLDGASASAGAPWSRFKRLTDGRILVTYSIPGGTGKVQLTFLLVEATNG